MKEAIQSVPYALTKVNLFRSDRGKEFDHRLIDEMLVAFGITRSLSKAGCPYDNAVAERTYRSFKIEFVQQENFHTPEELTLKTKDDVYWWNHHRIHGGLNYQTPMTRKSNRLRKTLYNFCTENCCLFNFAFLFLVSGKKSALPSRLFCTKMKQDSDGSVKW